MTNLMDQWRKQVSDAGIESNDGNLLIGKGRQVVRMMRCEVRETKAGDGKYLNIGVQVQTGPSKRLYYWEKINYLNKSEKTMLYARDAIISLAEACGVKSFLDVDELPPQLLNKVFAMNFKHGIGQNGDVEAQRQGSFKAATAQDLEAADATGKPSERPLAPAPIDDSDIPF